MNSKQEPGEIARVHAVWSQQDLERTRREISMLETWAESLTDLRPKAQDFVGLNQVDKVCLIFGSFAMIMLAIHGV